MRDGMLLCCMQPPVRLLLHDCMTFSHCFWPLPHLLLSPLSPLLCHQVSAEDKKTVLEAVKEALEWVEENPEADADEFNDKRKELEDTCAPIVSKLYAAGGDTGGDAGSDDDDLGDHDEL